MNRTDKAALIEKIKASAKNASIAVVADFKG
ncbi:50S ribosomal protein L10, partial [Desulfovibrio sp. OttesenSCG-928-A18]|nr:50S ribosomal protein L10 [Desulfovibrio sp. OttesenSCG-928-A18]